MLLREPPPTQADWHFRWWGVPVRVSPWFWLGAVLLGYGGSQRGELWELLVWIVAVFLSIMIHELGHVLALRAFGVRSHIVLYQFGGLAIPSASGYLAQRWTLRWLRWRDLIVAAAGPGAQLSGAIVWMAGLRACGIGIPAIGISMLPLSWSLPMIEHEGLRMFVHDFVGISIGWALLNLLPVLPLDGGVICRSILLRWDRHDPRKHTLIVSIVTAALVTLYAFSRHRPWMGVMFGLLGYQNYQQLQDEFGGGQGSSGRWSSFWV